MIEQEKIGEFLKSLRKAKGLTQSEVADAIYVSPKSISRWEIGDGLPDVSVMPALCDLFDITVDELLRGKRSTANKEENINQNKISDKNSVKLIRNTVVRRFNRFLIPSLIVLGSSVLVAFILGFLNMNLGGIILFICGVLTSFILNLIGKSNCVLDEEDFDNVDIATLKEGMKLGIKHSKRRFYLVNDFLMIAVYLFVIYLAFFCTGFYHLPSSWIIRFNLVIGGAPEQWIIGLVGFGVLAAATYIPLRVICAKYEGIERRIKIRNSIRMVMGLYLLYITLFLVPIQYIKRENYELSFSYGAFVPLKFRFGLDDGYFAFSLIDVSVAVAIIVLAIIGAAKKNNILSIISFASIIPFGIYQYCHALCYSNKYDISILFDMMAVLSVVGMICLLVVDGIITKKLKEQH